MADSKSQRGMTVEATTGKIQVGSASSKPILHSDTFMTFKAKVQAWALNGVYTADGDMTFSSPNTILGQGTTPIELVTQKILSCTGGNIYIFKARLGGVKGAHFNAGPGFIKIDGSGFNPEIQTDEDILFTAQQYINLVTGTFEAKKSIKATSTNGKIIVGDKTGSSVKFVASQVCQLTGVGVDLFMADMLGLAGMTIDSTTGLLTMGTETLAPKMATNQSISLTSNNGISLVRGDLQAWVNIIATAHKGALSIGNNNVGPELTARHEAKLLGNSLNLYNGKITGIKSLRAESTVGPLQIGTGNSEPTLNSDVLIHLIGKEKIQALSGVYTSNGDIIAISPIILIGQMLKRVVFDASKLLTLTGESKISLQNIKMTGGTGLTVTARTGELGIGQGTLISEIKTKGPLTLTAAQQLKLVKGTFEAEKEITATSIHSTLSIGDHQSAPQLTSKQHMTLVGHQVDVINGSLSS